MFGDTVHETEERLERVVQAGVDRVTEEVGGPARRRVIVLLACALGLEAADVGTIAALAYRLEQVFHIGNPELGLLVTASALMGAVGTIPMGAMADRFPRVRVLTVAVVLWAVAQAATGFSTSYAMLLVVRVALGAMVAAAGPIVASLTGDLFPAADRGRMWGFILTGEVLGTGFGILIAGLVASLVDWRAAFFVLAVPSLALAFALRRLLPEPARGGQSRLAEGADEIPAAVDDDTGVLEEGPSGGPPHSDDMVPRLVAEEGIEPQESTALQRDPEDLNLWQAILYVLRVRTNVVLIVASALGYFFFTGLETFAVIFVRGQYGVGQGAAAVLLVVIGVGVMAGLVVTGRLGDRFLRRGRLDARLVVGALGFFGAVVVLAPGIASPWLALSLPLFIAAGFLVAAPNPGLDAARLDVVPARMWGRAEGVRTLLRQSLQAFAPLVFGLVSAAFGGASNGLGTGVDVTHARVSTAQTSALELTFLVMLVPVVAGGAMLLLGRSSYPTDVASAAETDRLSRARSGSSPPGRGEPVPAAVRGR